jgi:type II secretory pathway pseudopilin PulG
MKQRKHGFTLVELLTIVAILGLFTSLSVAALGPLRDRYNLRQAGELVASAAARAQLQARETGRCHTLQVYTLNAAGTAVPVSNLGDEGDRLRVGRRTTADCGDSTEAAPHEEIEWVRMPGRSRVRVTGTSEPEWRPNSRLRKGATELRVWANVNEELVIQLMAPGAVCVSELPLEVCP